MHRLSLGLLVLVAAFLAGLAGFLVARGRAVKPEPVEPVSHADYRIKEVHIQEESGGNVRWKLDADRAEVFQQLGKTSMRKVTVTIREPDRTWTVTGDEGELVDASRDVELRRNVVLVSTDGLRLETETLRWDARGRKVWTDDPVTLVRNGAVLRGRGLEAWMSEERTRVKGRLRVTIHRERSAPVSLFGVPQGVP
jgi:LPS export ABC transporter protein LptC